MICGKAKKPGLSRNTPTQSVRASRAAGEVWHTRLAEWSGLYDYTQPQRLPMIESHTNISPFPKASNPSFLAPKLLSRASPGKPMDFGGWRARGLQKRFCVLLNFLKLPPYAWEKLPESSSSTQSEEIRPRATHTFRTRGWELTVKWRPMGGAPSQPKGKFGNPAVSWSVVGKVVRTSWVAKPKGPQRDPPQQKQILGT